MFLFIDRCYLPANRLQPSALNADTVRGSVPSWVQSQTILVTSACAFFVVDRSSTASPTQHPQHSANILAYILVCVHAHFDLQTDRQTHKNPLPHFSPTFPEMHSLTEDEGGPPLISHQCSLSNPPYFQSCSNSPFMGKMEGVCLLQFS